MDILIKNIEMPLEGGCHELVIDDDGEVRIYGTDVVVGEAVAYGEETPMKVTDIHVDEFYCPACGEEIGIYLKVWQRYCPMCGQRIYQEGADNE